MTNNAQIDFSFYSDTYKKSDALINIKRLIRMHKEGKLGGEIMPEDARPSIIDINSSDNYHFLSLPMALNYQRNSYKLWEAAALTYLDPFTKDVFSPSLVILMTDDDLRIKLTKYKLALQPIKHIDTWRKLSSSFYEFFRGDLRNLFEMFNNDVSQIKKFMQEDEKKRFPYLSGHKICNYWLHVMEIYTPTKFINRFEITVAPDTHIIQGTLKLGVLTGNIEEIEQNRTVVSDEWKKILSETGIAPIDIHTPLWLWSKRGFPEIIEY